MDTASIAKKIVRDSALRDPRETLPEFRRNIIGRNSIRLNVPLFSVSDLRRHISMMEDTAHRIGMMLDKSKEPDHSKIYLARAKLRDLNQDINAYRWPSRG